jgi:hypothetical protein
VVSTCCCNTLRSAPACSLPWAKSARSLSERRADRGA